MHIAVDLHGKGWSRDRTYLEVEFNTDAHDQWNVPCSNMPFKDGTCSRIQGQSSCGETSRLQRDVTVTMVEPGNGMLIQILGHINGIDGNSLISDTDLAIRVVGINYVPDFGIKGARNRIVSESDDVNVLNIVPRHVDGPQH